MDYIHYNGDLYATFTRFGDPTYTYPDWIFKNLNKPIPKSPRSRRRALQHPNRPLVESEIRSSSHWKVRAYEFVDEDEGP
jgi:hypothetical protein